VEKCAESHDRIASDYHELVRDHETLRAAGNELSEAYDELEDDFETLRQNLRFPQSTHDDAESCLYLADTPEKAKTCLD
jgi:hypothetical protein